MNQSDESYIVEIRVVRLADEDDLCDEDRELPSSVIVKVDPDVRPDLIANAALDAFHFTIPVKALDDFEFEIWMNNEEIFEGDGDNVPESYSLKGKANVLESKYEESNEGDSIKQVSFTVKLEGLVDLNGLPKEALEDHIRRGMLEAIGNGLITGHTEAEVDEYALSISVTEGAKAFVDGKK